MILEGVVYRQGSLSLGLSLTKVVSHQRFHCISVWVWPARLPVRTTTVMLKFFQLLLKWLFQTVHVDNLHWHYCSYQLWWPCPYFKVKDTMEGKLKVAFWGKFWSEFRLGVVFECMYNILYKMPFDLHLKKKNLKCESMFVWLFLVEIGQWRLSMGISKLWYPRLAVFCYMFEIMALKTVMSWNCSLNIS